MTDSNRTTVGTVLVMCAVLAAMPVTVASVGAQQQTVDCSYPMTVEDATGTDVTVDSEPQRVVALAPSAAQTMWEIGAEEKVVGMPVSQYTAYLNGSENRTNVVNSPGEPKAETIVGLQPDLVLAPHVIDNDSVENLRAKGLTVYRFHISKSLGDVYDKTSLTGRLVGEFEGAARTRAEMEAEVSAIEQAVQNETRPTVYYAMGGGYTAGESTFIHEIITTAGGHNVASEANITGYQTISQEIIAREDPDFIVLNEGMELPDNAATQNSTAVRNDQVVRVDANYLNQPGPRNVIPIRTLAAAFHPDAYESVTERSLDVPDPAACADASGTATAAETVAVGDEAETTAQNGAGFGATVGVAALAVVGGLLRRRD